MKNRTIVALALALGLAPGFGIAPAAAQTEVKVGLIAPMSGPWARQGDLMLKGANLAIEHINAAGGIKALNGAKMKLLDRDALAGKEHPDLGKRVQLLDSLELFDRLLCGVSGAV